MPTALTAQVALLWHDHVGSEVKGVSMAGQCADKTSACGKALRVHAHAGLRNGTTVVVAVRACACQAAAPGSRPRSRPHHRVSSCQAPQGPLAVGACCYAQVLRTKPQHPPARRHVARPRAGELRRGQRVQPQPAGRSRRLQHVRTTPLDTLRAVLS